MAYLGAPLSEIDPIPRKVIFVGGPGRSGTSFIAGRLGRHPDVCLLPDIELKLLTEKNGIMDLYHTLVQTYSPNRATVAIVQFKNLFQALIDGQFGQPGLASISQREDWLYLLDTFLEELTIDGLAGPTPDRTLRNAARDLLWRIGVLAARNAPSGSNPTTFLEKTPHALLAIEFLASIVPGARYIHVMRDPRSIAQSLQKMTWGPDGLAECCTWVSNYLEAWLKSRIDAEKLGLFPVSIQIEAIAKSPEGWSEVVCRQALLSPQTDLFRGADTPTLNGWTQHCSTADLNLLNSRLSFWASRFGYDAAKVGSPNGSAEPPTDLACA